MSDRKRTLPERLRAANAELLAFGNDYSDLLLDAAAEIERMEDALEFYANRNNWDGDYACGVDIDYGGGDGCWKPDMGYMARRALRVLDDDD